jgi:hypothetical protein
MTQGIYDTTQPYPRDLIGYGRKPPQAEVARAAPASPCSSC